MLDVTQTLKSDCQERLRAAYRSIFDDQDPHYLALVEDAAATAVNTIAKSNAAYHNVEHTLYVTAAGVSILAGKQTEAPLTTKQWAEAVISMLFHDIGFVRGLCKQDADDNVHYYSGVNDKIIELKRGTTDASMLPYHVDRGQCFASDYFSQNSDLDIELIRQCIERTRFPIPDDPAYHVGDDMPGLVRAADLIGQFSDPRYLNKLAALFQEFDELGMNARIGYESLSDMYAGYPPFYENQVFPYVKDGIRLLELTEVGKEILVSLENNLATARTAAAQLEH